MKQVYPLRDIAKRRIYRSPSHPHGTYSVVVTLECGHEQYYKGSREPKRSARCQECWRASERFNPESEA